MNFNLYNGLIFAGSLQGFVFVMAVLLQRKYRALSNYYLSAVILTFALDNLQYLLVDSGACSMQAMVTGFYMPFAMLTAPFFLQYGRLLLGLPHLSGRWRFWLYLPFVVAFLTSTLLKIFVPDALGYTYFVTYEVIVEIFAIVLDMSVVAYLFFEVQIALDKAESGPSVRLHWFRRVLLVLFAAGLVWFAVIIADYILNTELWYAVYLASSALIYWFGHIGLYEFGLASERAQLREFSIQQPALVIPSGNHKIKVFEDLIRNEKRYLDPQLSLEKIAMDLQMSKTHLSRLINNELGKGFSEYVNVLRVEEAKTYLNHPDFSQYTLAAVGLEAGFASKTTFNQAFKRISGQTPSEYRDQMRTSTAEHEETLA